jgi:hypothetical protein
MGLLNKTLSDMQVHSSHNILAVPLKHCMFLSVSKQSFPIYGREIAGDISKLRSAL